MHYALLPSLSAAIVKAWMPIVILQCTKKNQIKPRKNQWRLLAFLLYFNCQKNQSYQWTNRAIDIDKIFAPIRDTCTNVWFLSTVKNVRSDFTLHKHVVSDKYSSFKVVNYLTYVALKPPISPFNPPPLSLLWWGLSVIGLCLCSNIAVHVNSQIVLFVFWYIHVSPQITMHFLILVLLRRTSFMTTIYGLYFNHLTHGYIFKRLISLKPS